MIFLRLKNYWQMIFLLLLSVLIKRSLTFLQILLQLRTVSSPPEAKPKQQQRNKTSRFPVVLNEDFEKLKSVEAKNKYLALDKTVDEHF